MRTAMRFWRALEAIPGQADVIGEWRLAFGEDFDLARRFLRPTERRAKVFRCPKPGGQGCPRRVVVHGKGDIVAVCANVERDCDSLELAEADIIVQTLDHRRLGSAVAGALGIKPNLVVMEGLSSTLRIGEDRSLPGKRFPLFFTIPQGPDGFRKAVLSLVATVGGPFVFLTPTDQRVERDAAHLLIESKAAHLPLSEVLGIDGAGTLAAMQPPADLLAEFRASASPTAPENTVAERFPTPFDTTWERILMEFHADEVMLVKCGSVVRRVEPEQMGMKSRKSGRPTLQWTLLRTLALTGGTIPLQSPKDHDRVKKQKSELSSKLKAYFQLPGEPIVWKLGEYAWEAAFRIRAVNLRESSLETSP
ncbi:MAG: hypothetical protein HQL59_06370 [Magnetococcales bacterium]|nr:hypothetical protein [Magnetococcales bacterium]